MEKTIKKNLNILVVDDSSVARKIVNKLLKDLGLSKIQEAFDGENALSLITETKEAFDLIISDINMPKMDGIQLLKSLRENENEKLKLIPFIIVSAEVEKKTMEKAKEAGVSAYLNKPLNLSELEEIFKNKLQFHN
jgi:two-component system chemotaxis response regulator CheY